MKQYNRRRFLQTAGGTLMLAPFTRAGFPQPNDTGKKLRIALCGLGVYAQILADGIAESKYCRLAGIITGTSSKAELWKKRYNIPDSNIYNYDNFDQLAGNKDIDLIYVVLPNSMHKEFTLRAAKAGKHVITEKPMATNAADCEAMIRACKDAGVQLGVGYRLHFEPYNREMKRLGQEKVFGQVRLMEISLGYKADDGTGWRTHRALSGGGPLMNLGVYCVQAARYVSGEEPIAVTAQFNPVVNKKVFAEVEASITWQLEFPSGAVCNSTSTYTAGVDRLFAAGEKGFFELSPAISYGPFKGRTSDGEFHFPEINQQAAQLDAMATDILSGKPLPDHISGEEGWKDCRIMDAIYRAATTGQRIVI
jgi:predicted dehydrogenase